jgi:hypothetical protein
VAAEDSTSRVRDLTERILAFERHALALKDAFRSDVLRTEAQSVVTTLQLLEIALRGSPPVDVIQNAEELFAAATERLTRVGAAL